MKLATTLVVVESPNKIGKISKLLGPGYLVVASVGHVRDLPETSLGVDRVTFTPTYEVLETKLRILARLQSEASRALVILLATDADREGEAIAWHVAEALRLRAPRRVRFQELTVQALERAVQTTEPLDLHLVDAQQARRVIDRFVGYLVSPLLRVFGAGHSAGRVQSATLHLVCLRELARLRFSPVEFWSLTAVHEGFSTKRAVANDNGVWAIGRFASHSSALRAQEAAERCRHVVHQVESTSVQQKPKPPFTTSTLQQVASAQLNFKPDQTMRAAQALFEMGAITYHRTDSVALSDEGIAIARKWLSEHHPLTLPTDAVRYRAGARSQEAHEAVRPTGAEFDIGCVLPPDEASLLELISFRFFASQCKPAVIQRTTIRIRAGEVAFMAVGNVVTFPSFLKFLAGNEDSPGPAGSEDVKLPAMVVGQELKPIRFEISADSTKPLPRFTQATLVREMERCGIGRPSTFASSLKTLFDRGYVDEEKKSVVPTARGRLIDGAVSAAFPTIVDAEYTALMERRLDEIAAGRRRWKDELKEWYMSFSEHLLHAPSEIAKWGAANSELVESASSAPKAADKPCPRCGKPLFIRRGKSGQFFTCGDFPKCTYSADTSAQPCDSKCPSCAGAMEELDGKHGHWARCLSAGCTGRRDIAKHTGNACPRCKAPMVDKGEFLGCSKFPACRFTVEQKVLQRALKKMACCPMCQRLLIEKRGPSGKFLSCAGFPECRHTQTVASKKRAAHV